MLDVMPSPALAAATWWSIANANPTALGLAVTGLAIAAIAFVVTRRRRR